jgi:RHS repeat-associated protein
VAAVDGSGNWIRGEVYAGGRHVATYSGGASGTTLFNFADNLGTESVRATVSGTVAETCTSLPFGDWLTCTGSDSSPMHFTGKERDSESGNDYFGARYMSSQYGRFMSPDPSGGHFMNPQSLNRYAYVHNNPLNLIDPTGRDCVYTDNLDSDGTVTVQRGDCTSDTDNGIFVNGTIDTNSFNLTQDQNGDLSLGFGYTNDDTGNFSLFSTNLPGMSGFNGFGSGFGFGSPNYAANVFSQVYNNTQALTNPRNIAGFYGASALAGAAGLGAATYGPQLATALQTYGPQALAKLGVLGGLGYQLGQRLLYDPQVEGFLSDVVQGLTPGTAPPATWAGFGAALASSWQQVVQTGQQVYQDVKGSIPH